MFASNSSAALPSYQETDAYHGASPERRRQINRYKKECDISDDHMYLLMHKQDLENVPDEVREKSDFSSNALLVFGVLLLLNTLNVARGGINGGADVSLIFLSLGSFVLVAIVFFTGMLNPYKRDLRDTNKRLKKLPDVPDFTEWDIAHPNREDRKSAKAQRR